MVIECDEPPGDTARAAIADLDWVHWVRALDKVGG
jgi:hypothetical protein